jgi:hypothetical protein
LNSSTRHLKQGLLSAIRSWRVEEVLASNACICRATSSKYTSAWSSTNSTPETRTAHCQHIPVRTGCFHPVLPLYWKGPVQPYCKMPHLQSQALNSVRDMSQSPEQTRPCELR